MANFRRAPLVEVPETLSMFADKTRTKWELQTSRGVLLTVRQLMPNGVGGFARSMHTFEVNNPWARVTPQVPPWPFMGTDVTPQHIREGTKRFRDAPTDSMLPKL